MPRSSDDTTRQWLGPLLAVLVAQIAVSFLSRLASTLAPALSARMQWQVTDIGLLSSVTAVGSALFMLMGLPLILRAGPVRSLQAGLLVGAVGTLLYALPWDAGPVVGSLLIGFALGPQASAGSDVLRRYSPAGSHNLVFSLKQAGVPLGGVLAGLLMPRLADSMGLIATFVVCAALTLGAMAVIQPLQRRLDMTRDTRQVIHIRLLLSLNNLQRPLRSLANEPNLRRVATVGACLALGQGVWFIFLISYLVQQLGISLPAAGALFALMQVVSVVARPAMGWLADRIGRRPAAAKGARTAAAGEGTSAGAVVILKVCCIASALTTLALALLTPQWPHGAIVALMVAAGCTVSSWNGVQGAQIAHFARPGAVAESTTGAALLIFLANIVGPALFGAIVALGGDFRVGFALAAVATLAGMWPLAKLPKLTNA